MEAVGTRNPQKAESQRLAAEAPKLVGLTGNSYGLWIKVGTAVVMEPILVYFGAILHQGYVVVKSVAVHSILLVRCSFDPSFSDRRTERAKTEDGPCGLVATGGIACLTNSNSKVRHLSATAQGGRE